MSTTTTKELVGFFNSQYFNAFILDCKSRYKFDIGIKIDPDTDVVLSENTIAQQFEKIAGMIQKYCDQSIVRTLVYNQQQYMDSQQTYSLIIQGRQELKNCVQTVPDNQSLSDILPVLEEVRIHHLFLLFMNFLKNGQAVSIQNFDQIVRMHILESLSAFVSDDKGIANMVYLQNFHEKNFLRIGKNKLFLEKIDFDPVLFIPDWVQDFLKMPAKRFKELTEESLELTTAIQLLSTPDMNFINTIRGFIASH